MRRFSLYSFGVLIGMGLIACGSPEVPLTRPPQNAFRVEEPVTTPPTTDPLITTLLEREASDPTTPPSVLALAAQFWGLAWPPEPPILLITARFWGVDWPPPAPEATSETTEDITAETNSNAIGTNNAIPEEPQTSRSAND